MSAVAAGRIKQADRPALIVDAGSAVTVDLIDPSGEFLCAPFCPGRRLLARARRTAPPSYHFSTTRPTREQLVDPPAVGTSTDAAIRSGIHWGLVSRRTRTAHCA